MARTIGTLLSPKERRRIVDAKPKRRVVEIHPSADTAAYTVEDRGEETREHKATFLEVCWPAVFGIVLAFFAEGLRLRVMGEWGDVGDRLVFPFVQIASRRELGLGDTTGLAMMVLYLQFPLTGLYATWNLSRQQRLSTTIMQILFVYGVTAFVLWLLTQPVSPHGM